MPVGYRAGPMQTFIVRIHRQSNEQAGLRAGQWPGNLPLGRVMRVVAP